MSVYTYQNGLTIGQAINKINAKIDFFNIGGAIMPLFGSQLTRNTTLLHIITSNTKMKEIKLNFESTPVSNKEQSTGKLTIDYLSENVWTTSEDILTTLELNHTRNFSAYRHDVIHWKIESDTDTIFSVWFYNLEGSKTFSSIKVKVRKIKINETDSIHYII